MNNFVEICCGSYEDAFIAKEAGADQIELNSALFLGGLTPSTGVVKLIKENIDIKIIAMARPRAGGFYYNEFEYSTIIKDVEELLSFDVDGIVFGCLTEDREINIEKNKKIVDLIKSKNKLAVFHRAFDQTVDPFKATEELIELGVDRVLTSGQKNIAIDGVDLLKELENKYGDRIEFLIGSGVNSENVSRIYNATGIKNFHSSCRMWREDPTTIGNVSYEYGNFENKNKYEVTSLELARKFVESVMGL